MDFWKLLERWGILGLLSGATIFYLGDKYKGLQRCNTIHRDLADDRAAARLELEGKIANARLEFNKKTDDFNAANQREFGEIKAMLASVMQMLRDK